MRGRRRSLREWLARQGSGRFASAVRSIGGGPGFEISRAGCADFAAGPPPTPHLCDRCRNSVNSREPNPRSSDPEEAESRSGTGGGPAAKSAQPALDPRPSTSSLLDTALSRHPSPWRASHSRRDLPPSRFSTDQQAKADHLADLTFALEWLNFPGLWAEGCALESRSVTRTTRTALARRICPPNQSDWRTGGASGRNPRNPRGGATGISDTNRGVWPPIPTPPCCMARNHAWRPSYCRG